MITRISDSVWKVVLESNVYFIDGKEKIVIDTGPRTDGAKLRTFLSKVVDFDKVERVFLTHLHYDHIGNFDMFPNASFHASEEEIAFWKKDPKGAILDEWLSEKFKPELTPFPKLDWLQVIKTPGHTVGSVCFWMPSERVLFSGDTIFSNGQGRTDLPSSVAGMMRLSIVKLVDYNYRFLCPGHDY